MKIRPRSIVIQFWRLPISKIKLGVHGGEGEISIPPYARVMEKRSTQGLERMCMIVSVLPRTRKMLKLMTVRVTDGEPRLSEIPRTSL